LLSPKKALRNCFFGTDTAVHCPLHIGQQKIKCEIRHPRKFAAASMVMFTGRDTTMRTVITTLALAALIATSAMAKDFKTGGNQNAVKCDNTVLKDPDSNVRADCPSQPRHLQRAGQLRHGVCPQNQRRPPRESSLAALAFTLAIGTSMMARIHG
jgi:hypothetical protein